MQPDSLGKLLSQTLLPYGQQWAESSGLSLISKLLGDEQLHALIERYAQEMLASWTEPPAPPPKSNGRHNGNGHADDANFDGADLQQLNARLLAIEAQRAQLQTFLATVRSKMRPLALALGCCPECVVGVEDCPRCEGKSSVAGYPPDLTLLQALIVDPLAASGVPLKFADMPRRFRVADVRNHLRKETGASHE